MLYCSQSNPQERGHLMKLRKNCNLEQFLNLAKTCRSSVTFHTPDGDVLEMRSVLCQYIFLSLQNQPELLYGGIVCCEDNADYELLSEFLQP